MSANEGGTRICVVGSSTHFLSGISYYTVFLTEAFAARGSVSVILMRRLVPRRLYPGRGRVGMALTPLSTADHAPTFDGVDWYLLPSLVGALKFYDDHPADVVVFQWWTAAVTVPYLVLAAKARRRGARIIIEFHEDQDTGEVAFPLAKRIGRIGLSWLVNRADGFVAHSEWDRARLCRQLGVAPERMQVVRHGPYPLVAGRRSAERAEDAASHGLTLLFFGTIRPYKGLEYLVDAFEMLARERADVRLVIVGERWEGWDLPIDKVARSPFADRITLVDRYVSDDETRAYFEQADVVVLPYLRSSASGPLHLAMAAGLPVVITDVGGLTEVASRYSGAVLCRPADAPALARAVVAAERLVGERYDDSYSWRDTAEAYLDLCSSLGK